MSVVKINMKSNTTSYNLGNMAHKFLPATVNCRTMQKVIDKTDMDISQKRTTDDTCTMPGLYCFLISAMQSGYFYFLKTKALEGGEQNAAAGRNHHGKHFRLGTMKHACDILDELNVPYEKGRFRSPDA